MSRRGSYGRSGPSGLKLRVTGLAELDRALRAMGKDVQGELVGQLKDIAEMVAGRARAKVPRVSGRAAASIVSRSTGRKAGLAFGGNRAPYYAWLDFGGSVGRGHRERRAWSGAITREWMGVPVGEGRYVYPAIRESRDDIGRALDDAIESVARSNGFDTRGGA